MRKVSIFSIEIEEKIYIVPSQRKMFSQEKRSVAQSGGFECISIVMWKKPPLDES